LGPLANAAHIFGTAPGSKVEWAGQPASRSASPN